MNYSRIEVNLLPPELQPGPAVRFALLINIALIAGTVAFLLIHFSMSLASIANLSSELSTIKKLVDGMQPIRDQHERLTKINDSVENYGRLVALASADYVAMPVVMEKLSRVLPDGVIVEGITNQGTRRRGDGTVLVVRLRTADQDINRMTRTIEGFKREPMFADSYMRSGNVEEATLDDFLETINVNWTASGPGLNDRLANRHYFFELVTTIPPGYTVEGMPVVFDQSRFYDVKFKIPPPEPEEEPTPAEKRRLAKDTEEAAKAAKEGEDS